MNKINYQIIMEKIIKENCTDRTPKLLLHSCCGPCSTFCIESLAKYFEVTVFYYNPNIFPEEEYHMRVNEQKRFIEEFPTVNPVHFVEWKYDTENFYNMAKGLEKEKEGGKRCFKCYEMRLNESAKYAADNGFDFVTTTLSISPLKNSSKLNEIGERVSKEYGVSYLFSDFKKKDGYKKSTEISKEYGMYRQYYCGCVYSKKQRDEEIANKDKIK